MNTSKIAHWADEDHWYQPWPFILGWLYVAIVEGLQEWFAERERQ